MRHAAPARLLPVLLVAGFGCARPASPPSPRAGSAAKAPRTEESYPLVGVVTKVEAEKGLVEIRHEEIKGFMPAMKMPFRPKDRSALDDVRAGDEVEGILRVVKDGGEVSDYDLEDLVVTRPATGPVLTLSVGDGSAKLAPAAKPLSPGEAVPDFTMTAQDGTPLRLSDLRGKVVALTFVYTRCPLPAFCPAMDKKFAALADAVSAVPGRADAFRLVSLSFDPEHDTPDVLRKHAKMRGAVPPLWTFAVASHAELARVAPRFGLTYGPRGEDVVHSLATAVIGPDGRLVRLVPGGSWAPADVLKTMYASIPPSKP